MFYSDEANLTNNTTKINTFFSEQLQQDFLTTRYGTLYYGFAIPQQATTAIIISSGRIESLFKYKELLWELYQNGYAVFIVDHQGQGRSYRLLKNTHKGYVNRFSDYADDFATFNEKVVQTHWQGKQVLLGHSMGCAIAYDFLSRYQHTFSGAFLSAPMFDIYTKGTPKPLAKLAAKIASLIGLGRSYAFGQNNYLPVDFTVNELTSSEVRYKQFRELYLAEPDLQLGGVTYGWLNASFDFIATLVDRKVSIPLFIASAEQDTVVDNAAQFALTHRQKKARLKSYPHARHELLFERDEIRHTVLTDFYQFCDSL
ncbi:alpha/beta fold hydrolase [Pseudoalteromonas sp. L21]|uniref:alpha/beta fold hydrolase n=1 Tax=Pseudoalteromonas sp. L21 TaxID=1539746 RepID=UPI001F3351DF|nr:alpha/beta fold hydrolase [Pseudoalteromonas sp. L21]MCF7519950.1 alpha/beta fold hydrolase [Pseudoalteromonas sp. L21]